MTSAAYFDFHHTVASAEIDSQGHVHNLRYLQWTLGAAGAHSSADGWDAASELERGFGWVVRSHDVTYRAAAVAGDEIVVRTWVHDIAKFASRRKYLVCRPADQTVLAKVETRWVYVDLRVHKVVAIPGDIACQLQVLESPPAMPWEN
jgi:acyl-CoA thioester hydrolase